MNHSDAVPSRIVVVGTSKLRLSERFNRIQTEKAEQQRQQKLQKPPPPAPQRKRSERENVLSVPVIERPRVFQRPAATGDVGKSFLHDDYMDNELYGEYAIRDQVQQPARLRSNGGYQNSLNDFNDVNPVNLTLDDYNVYNRMRVRRPYYSRSYQKKYEFNEDDEFYDLNGAYPSRPRSKFYNDSSFRRPIQQRLSFRPSRNSDFSLRRPIRNTFSFKRPYRGRFGGGWRAWYGVGSGNRSGRGGGEGSGGDGLRKSRWNEKRFKKSVQELDRELDEYMKAGKHPRIHSKG